MWNLEKRYRWSYLKNRNRDRHRKQTHFYQRGCKGGMNWEIGICIYTLLMLLLSRFSRVQLCAPHRWKPTRLPCPWDSPGKNTGVGCHFLLQCVKVKSESEVTQLCPTLSDPMDYSLPGSSVHGIFQARVLEWGALPSPIHYWHYL